MIYPTCAQYSSRGPFNITLRAALFALAARLERKPEDVAMARADTTTPRRLGLFSTNRSLTKINPP